METAALSPRTSTLPTLDPDPDVSAPPGELALEIAARTDVGRVRTRNEDQFVVAQLGRWVRVQATSVGRGRDLTRSQGTLLMVADGMGGHGGGDVASAVMLDAFVEHSLLEMPWLGYGAAEGDALLAADFTRFLAECQVRIVEVAALKDLPPRLGTTLTVAYFTPGRLILVHVGDTRAYLFRGGVLRRLTRDHTLGAELGPTAEGRTLSHVLTNAIGGNKEPPKPDLMAIPLEPGDRVLLCSDGLHGLLDDGAIAQLLGRGETAQAVVDGLVTGALAAGAPDNVTAVVAFAGATPRAAGLASP